MSGSAPPLVRTVLLTALALGAFAGNSLLCRLALGRDAIDPWSFTTLRLVSGAVALAPFVRLRGTRGWRHVRPLAPLALAGYAIGFSLAYVTLEAGTGALLLFGAVQATMLGYGFLRGERATWRQVAGLVTALAGLVLLVSPGVTAPDPVGAVFMVGAGVAWGVYSLLGRGALHATAATGWNFLFAAPLGALLLWNADRLRCDAEGALLAIASGALTSGLGYALWYAGLRGHSATSAAVVQLSVPALAALGGVALLGEHLSGRLVAASLLTLGGVLVALRGRLT